MEDLPIRKITLANDFFFSEVKTYLDKGQLVKIPVLGKSMKPFLVNGDTVIIEPINNVRLQIGHIALAKTDMGYMLHRIIKILDEDVWMAGDGNIQQIERIKNEDVLGVVKEAYRKGSLININSNSTLFAAKLWYMLRPMRRVFNKLSKIF